MKPTTHRTELVPTAEMDVETTFHNLYEFSPDWAVEWYRKLKEAVGSLDHLPERFGLAPEAEAIGRPIRQLIFGKRRNRYRVLYEVRDNVVAILRVRHGSQDLLPMDEL